MKAHARMVPALAMLSGMTFAPLFAAQPATRTGGANHGPLGAFSGALVTRDSEHLLAPQSPTQGARAERLRALLNPLSTTPQKFDLTLPSTVPVKLLEPKRDNGSGILRSEGSRLPRDR